MIDVCYMRPVYTKTAGSKIKMIFTYQDLEINKDELLYHFVPIEGKELVIDLKTHQIKNTHEVFVFQNGNKFIRLPVYHLIMLSNIMTHVHEFLRKKQLYDDATDTIDETTEKVVAEIIDAMEEIRLRSHIDDALTNRDETLFMELTEQLMKLQQKGDATHV